LTRRLPVNPAHRHLIGGDPGSATGRGLVRSDGAPAGAGGHALKTYALTVNLQNDPERMRRYVEEHTRVWPEVLAQIRKIGVQQMKIWRIGHHLFMYLETDDDFDLARDFGRVREDPRSVEWNDWMAREFQERSPFAREGEWWALMELAFDLKAALGEPTA
jgi:L-rhamnose mutarotase